MDSTTAARMEIERANAGFVARFAAGDIAAVGRMYTDDAKFIAPHQEVLSGRQAIEAFLKGAFDAGVKGVALSTLEVEAVGESAVEFGRYEMKTAAGDVADRGSYLVHWKKRNGAWRIHRDMIATELAAGG